MRECLVWKVSIPALFLQLHRVRHPPASCLFGTHPHLVAVLYELIVTVPMAYIPVLWSQCHILVMAPMCYGPTDIPGACVTIGIAWICYGPDDTDVLKSQW